MEPAQPTPLPHTLPYAAPASAPTHSTLVIPAAAIPVGIGLSAMVAGVVPAVRQQLLGNEAIFVAVVTVQWAAAVLSLMAAAAPHCKRWLAVLLLMFNTAASLQCCVVNLVGFHMQT